MICGLCTHRSFATRDIINSNKMIKVKKFASFEELKADAKEADNYKLSLKKHEEFQKVLKYIYSIAVQQKRSEELK